MNISLQAFSNLPHQAFENLDIQDYNLGFRLHVISTINQEEHVYFLIEKRVVTSQFT